MELQDYTTEELRAELRRRTELARAQRAEEMKTAMRCGDCKHCVRLSIFVNHFICGVRTWGTKHPRNYKVVLSQRACDKFEHKSE